MFFLYFQLKMKQQHICLFVLLAIITMAGAAAEAQPKAGAEFGWGGERGVFGGERPGWGGERGGWADQRGGWGGERGRFGGFEGR